MDSSLAHRKAQQRRRTTTTTTTASWCCSFKSPTKSPETLSLSSNSNCNKTHITNTKKKLNNHLGPTSSSSFPSSPQSQTSRSGLGIVGRIDPRRILSPGRVSPIDSDPIGPVNVGPDHVGPAQVEVGPARDVGSGLVEKGREIECGGGGGCGGGDVEGFEFDVRLSLKGKSGGGFMVLEVNSKVLGENSPVFEALIAECRKGGSRGAGGGGRVCRIEVPEVENVGVFRETIELMFEEDDVAKRLMKVGVYRAIDILEVAASIKFNRGVVSCLKYLEAVPWTEEEEEKLRRLFTKFKFDNATNNDILSRLNLHSSSVPQKNIASQLIRSITTCENVKARNELKPMVKGLLSKSSVYEKDHVDISKEDLYSVAQSCLSSLITLFQETSNSSDTPNGQTSKPKNPEKPLIESISWHVENINWLLEILLDRQLAEDFVDLWSHQKELVEMHGKASPMVRYELSRVSAALFVAMGTRKLQCLSDSRSRVFQSWFGPMILDFGWLQRCRKGLDVRELEEAMGQALLTLPLKEQYSLFMEWFRCFSKHGTECPNLSKAFQIWWRRSFLRGSETHAIESR